MIPPVEIKTSPENSSYSYLFHLIENLIKHQLLDQDFKRRIYTNLEFITAISHSNLFDGSEPLGSVIKRVKTNPELFFKFMPHQKGLDLITRSLRTFVKNLNPSKIKRAHVIFEPEQVKIYITPTNRNHLPDLESLQQNKQWQAVFQGIPVQLQLAQKGNQNL